MSSLTPSRPVRVVVAVAAIVALGLVRPTLAQFELLHSFDPEKGAPRAALTALPDGSLCGVAATGGRFGLGSIFRLTPDGSGGYAYVLLHSFSGADGALPYGPLLLAADGFLYGTTYTGGANGVGTVFSGTLFRIALDGTFALLHSFGGGDGARPIGGLVEGDDGFLYGTSWGGGSAGVGTLFRATSSGEITVLRSLSTANGSRPAAGLARGADGALYGATTAGGAAGCGTLFRLDPATGAFTLLRSLAAADGTAPFAALLAASDTHLYGLASAGGAAGAGTLFRLTLAGDFALLRSLAPAEGSAPLAALVETSSGELVGVASSGGAAGAGTLFRTDPLGGWTVLHDFAGLEGSAPQAALVEDAAGELVGAARTGGDVGAGTIFRWTGLALERLHSFARTANGGAAPWAAPLAATDGQLYGSTVGGGADNAGTLYRVDLAPATPTVATVASFGATLGSRPYAPLAQAADGRLYGSTVLGGSFGAGTAFRLDPATGTLALLHPYTPSEGSSPYAGFVAEPGGDLLGVSSMNGPAHGGALFRLTPAGSLAVLHGLESSEGTGVRAALVRAADGFLYGVAPYGGAHDLGTLFRFDGTSAVVALHSFDGVAGARPFGALHADADGWLYGATAQGGAANLGTLFRYSPASATFELLHSFAGSDGATPSGAPLGASDGALYVTTRAGGAFGVGALVRRTAAGAIGLVHSFSGPDGSDPYAGPIEPLAGTLVGTTVGGGAFGAGTLYRFGLTALPTLIELHLQPTNVKGGGTTTRNRVTLSAPAPTGGALVALASSNPAVATVPVSVLVPAGATSADFSIVTSAVTTRTEVEIRASYGATALTATLTVRK